MNLSLSRAQRWLFVAAMFAAPHALAADAPESRANVEEARSHFTRGVQLFKDGDPRAALVEFERANSIAPNYRVLYNIGQADLEIQDYAGALKAFSRYLAEGGAEVPAARKKEVEQEVARLAERVGRVTIRVNKPDAEISIDDVAIGRSPLPEPIVVSAGRRRITASSPPLAPVTKTIDVAGKDTLEIDLSIAEPTVPAPLPVVVAEKPKAPPPPPPPSRTPFWISLGVTGALGAATLTTGILSLSAKSTLNDRLNTFPSDDAAIADARSTLKTTALITDVCAIGTILGAGVTTYFAFKVFRPSTTASVDVGMVPGGLVASGHF